MCSRSPDRRAGAASLACAAMLSTTLLSCQDTRIVQREVPPGGERVEGVRQVPLRPGFPVALDADRENPYAGNVRALTEGERLYHWMNCSGCHFMGGGGIGPPLMDDDWIYGGQPVQIFDSIVNGRANGMPAYGDKLAAEQVWHIVTFVQTLGGGDSEGGDGP
jgi:cytochrome c oxidase cbb3-type subunit 3